MKLSEIASALGARLEGNAATEITGVAGIEEAGPGQLTFVANPRYAAAAKTTRASAVIVAEDFPGLGAATLRTRNPYLAFARALELFYQPPQYAPGVHPTAVLHPSAKIGKDVEIAWHQTLVAVQQLQRFVVSPERSEHRCQVVQHVGVIGVELQGAPNQVLAPRPIC